MSDVRVELGPVQQTLLFPLLARAEETRRGSGLLRDPRAVEIVERLDFDFAPWRGAQSLTGSALRARLFDEEVRAFLAAHPQGTVIELGAGLNSRYERLDNGAARWLEIDLPDTMALRRRFFADDARRTTLAASVLDADWLDAVDALPAPRCFVAEAVLPYLDEADVARAARQLSARFPGASLVADTLSTEMVENQGRHDIMGRLPRESWFRWGCDAPEALEDWGLSLETSRSYLNAPPEILGRMPLQFRILIGTLSPLEREKFSGYRINRFTFAPAGPADRDPRGSAGR